MAISLSKGGNVNLSKEAPGLNKIVIGLGWDARATDGSGFDLDASAFLVKQDGKVRSDADSLLPTWRLRDGLQPIFGFVLVFLLE